MKSFYVPILILVLLFMVVYFLVWPAYQETIAIRGELVSWEKKLEEVKEAKTRIAELEADYEKLKNEEDQVMRAIPSKSDLPGLIVQLEDLAFQNQLILDSILFSLPKSETKGAVAETASSTSVLSKTAIETMTANLNLNGTYLALKNFLNETERNSRLADVTSINFVAPESKSAVTAFGINLNLYYKK